MEVRVVTLLHVILELSLTFFPKALAIDRDKTNEVLLSNDIKLSKDLNTSELIAKYSYTAKDYFVTTEDGYILTVTRMENKGPVVLLTHGMVTTANFWIALGMESLPFILFDEGFDVYLVSTRDNKYTKHSRLSSEDREYWNYSFHDIGYYDLPALIDFALETSKKSQLAYIGHSQGTIAFFVMSSLRPEYNSKVNFMISMSTIAWLHHADAPALKTLMPLHNLVEFITKLGFYRITPPNDYLKYIFRDVCPKNKFTMFLCASTLFLHFGFDYAQLDFSQLSEQIIQIHPETSVKNLLHYAQIRASEDFRQYDYKNANMEIYGSKIPPSYPVKNITVPIAILHSDNDWLSRYEDVQILCSKLPNLVYIYRVPFDHFNHIDYIWGKDAKKLVYDKVVSLLEKYSCNIE